MGRKGQVGCDGSVYSTKCIFTLLSLELTDLPQFLPFRPQQPENLSRLRRHFGLDCLLNRAVRHLSSFRSESLLRDLHSLKRVITAIVHVVQGYLCGPSHGPACSTG